MPNPRATGVRSLVLVCLACAGPLAAGCGSGNSEQVDTVGSGGAGGGGEGGATTTTTSQGGGGTGGGGSELPPFDGLEPGKLHFLSPGGETICSRGDPYAFFVIPGAKDRVIVEFEGGGACWDQFTCSVADAIFKDKVQYPEPNTKIPGWYDHGNPEHPMKDWTHIYVPYCTGDVHWGDNVKTYGEGDAAFDIRHKGAVNVRAVLDWVQGEIPAPQKVFVTGCSAGGYGSIWWAPQIQKRFPDATVYHFSDSAAGIITDDFFEKSFPAWNAQASFPSFVGNYQDVKTLSTLYQLVAAHYSDRTYSQYNTLFDENQAFYFQAMGGSGAEEWSQGMLASILSIEQDAPNFRAFIAPGEQHCILPYDNFYTVEAGGQKLVDWLRAMVSDEAIDNAYCPDCAP